MTDLSARVEGLAGPDREVDTIIHYDVLGWCRHANKVRSGAQSDTGFDCVDCGADSWGNKSSRGQKLYDKLPAYTASLDAAMTLVPEGWWVRMTAGTGATVHMWLMGNEAESDAFTPALALCAAALKARGL